MQAWQVPLGVCTVQRDVDLPSGFTIRKGWTLFYSSYVYHRKPEVWASPNDFDPDRFLHQTTAFSFLAFHEGRHRCPGGNVAIVMAQVRSIRI